MEPVKSRTERARLPLGNMAVREDTLEPRSLEELQMDHNHGSSTLERVQIILIILPIVGRASCLQRTQKSSTDRRQWTSTSGVRLSRWNASPTEFGTSSSLQMEQLKQWQLPSTARLVHSALQRLLRIWWRIISLLSGHQMRPILWRATLWMGATKTEWIV